MPLGTVWFVLVHLISYRFSLFRLQEGVNAIDKKNPNLSAGRSDRSKKNTLSLNADIVAEHEER